MSPCQTAERMEETMKRTLRAAALCLLLTLSLLSSAWASALSAAEAANTALASQASVQPERLLDQEALLPAGSSASDWLAMAFALSGVEANYDGYLSRLESYVTGCYREQGCLHPVKATEYHRIALTVLALGGDPTAFGSYQGQTIDLIAQGTYNFSGELGAQGLNACIYALLTLDAGHYQVPREARYTREALCGAILAAQEPDGGFGLVSGSSDVDITAMALQALAPYQGNCAQAIQRALTYLSVQMSDDCTFRSYGAESAESVAQVLIALCALGIDPETDSRFVRPEMTLVQALERFRMPEGGYAHTLEENAPNLMATEQSLLALLALERREQGLRLFDFTDVRPVQTRSLSPLVWIIPLALLLLAGGGYVYKKRRTTHGTTDQ